MRVAVYNSTVYFNLYTAGCNKMAEAAQAIETARQKVAAMNLTPEQLSQYQRKFDAFDLNKDGTISLREFATVGKVFGYHLTKDEILVRKLYCMILDLSKHNFRSIDLTHF